MGKYAAHGATSFWLQFLDSEKCRQLVVADESFHLTGSEWGNQASHKTMSGVLINDQ